MARPVVARLALALLLLPAGAAGLAAQGKPRPARPFSARAAAATLFTVNRVQCGLEAAGMLCGQGNASSTDVETFWPRGTPNQYVFAAGLQVAAVIGPDGGPWAGDTTGAFFFDTKGTTVHGQVLEPLHLSGDPADAAAWPEAARVPQGDAGEAIYGPALRGRPFAAQGDVWQLFWDGDSARKAGRPHPLGVVVEQRTLAWDYPNGNQDVVYHVATFYNVTSTDPAAYAGVRPAMRELLLKQAQAFHRLNPAAPAGGYTMTDLHVGAMSDDDVGSAGVNYSTVSLPAAMGFSYERGFDLPPSWTLD
ncbi:MAG TPA: hypothetical protein VFS40_07290, partial [Gemmatimonadales bacterium]|nr:hypothetical protein [Gemmatimonadales bacterium]